MPTSTVSSTPSSLRIAELVASLRQLAAAGGTAVSFDRDWLQQITACLPTQAGRLRRPGADGGLSVVTVAGAVEVFEADAPEGTVDSNDAQLSAYSRLLLDAYATGRPQVVPPHASGAAAAANPTSGILIVAPLIVEGEVRGVVELVLPHDADPGRQRDAVQCVFQASQAMADFQRRLRDKKLADRQLLIDELERFIRAVHEKLDVTHVAYTAANDGRRLIGCDRVTVLLRRGRRYEVVAVSGLDVVERRSQAAKLLGRLSAAVAETGESLWYTGTADELSPQLREAVGQYIDETHVRSVAVLPLLPPQNTQAKQKPRPLGTLIIEQMEDAAPSPGREERARLVAEHTTASLSNALEHESIPLLPLWRMVGKARKLFEPGTRLRTAAVLTAIAAAAAALKFIPADFALSARGVLQPKHRQHVFAPVDGTVKAVHVRHGMRIEAGQLLVELRNSELDVQLADAVGQRAAAHEQLLAVERALFEDGKKLGVEERHRMAGQRSELKQRLSSLDEQLRLLRNKRARLRVTSPIAGEVTTWNIEQLLHNRPVRQGQILIDVADVAGPWELELQVPEDGIGHLLRAQDEQGPQLEVTYRPAADPEFDRRAVVGEVHWSAEVRGDEGNTVLVRAPIEATDLPALRPGAEATAKVYCGTRALGYVWLHDGVDFVRTKILFRMY